MSEPTLIPGKTLNKLELSNVTADMNGKKFTVVVKSQYGSVSSTGTLKVGLSPVISKHPVSVVGGLNVKIDFSVTVSGTEPLKYQWRKNGQNISGATQAIFSINSATLNDSGDYDVVVTNDFGTVYSQIANFIAGNKPVITTQPKSSVSLVGSETVSVVATGTAPLTYQWFKDTVAISGATSSSYNITSDGTYKVIVSNQVGSVTSTDCVVGAVIAPRIITQPFGTTTPALLKIVATGTSLTYKWYKNGVEISGQTQDSYIANDAGTYKVVVSNAAGSVTSNDVTLITVQPPLITLQPVGGDAPTLLSVTATGTAPLTYQWYKNDVPIAGATSSTYNATEEGQYKVFVSNAGGTVLSDFVNVNYVIRSAVIFDSISKYTSPPEGMSYALIIDDVNKAFKYVGTRSGMVELTSVGDNSWTAPAGVNSVIVHVIGGGGSTDIPGIFNGTGDVYNPPEVSLYHGRGSGGGGGYAVFSVSVESGKTYDRSNGFELVVSSGMTINYNVKTYVYKVPPPGGGGRTPISLWVNQTFTYKDYYLSENFKASTIKIGNMTSTISATNGKLGKASNVDDSFSGSWIGGSGGSVMQNFSRDNSMFAGVVGNGVGGAGGILPHSYAHLKGLILGKLGSGSLGGYGGGGGAGGQAGMDGGGRALYHICGPAGYYGGYDFLNLKEIYGKGGKKLEKTPLVGRTDTFNDDWNGKQGAIIIEW